VVLAATQLGSAVVASGLSPDEGLTVFAELQKARRCFVLENELHTIYLVRVFVYGLMPVPKVQRKMIFTCQVHVVHIPRN